MQQFANTTITTGGSFVTDSTGAQQASFYYPSPSNTIPIITTNGTTDNALVVQGDADFQGDVKIKGKSIIELLDTIESRLAILQPDPKKLEKYASLKKAYDHYKLMEKLIQDDE